MKKISLFINCILVTLLVQAQVSKGSATKFFIDSINRIIDRAVVKKQMVLLQKYYAHDFVFTHGTGLVDSKESWLKNVRDTSVHYLSREHDSTVVELHKEVAIISGTLTVKRQRPEGSATYALRYVRVFALRQKQWQMISHRTTLEWHL